MPKTMNEYTDIKNIKHAVSHLVLSENDQTSKERILEEIKEILSKQQKKFSVEYA